MQINSCEITAFYAETLDAVAISPAREDKVVGPTKTIATTDNFTFAFTFGDFDVVQSSGCEATYQLTYLLFYQGVDVTQSLPAWVSNFDPTVPTVSVKFLDESDLGL